jgi:sigma-B regulation protein RsbU (phosphoserine phosphatase)
MMGRSPSDVLATANNAICANNQEDMFVTVWLGILEISTGKLTAASAGHEYPAVMHAGGDYELWKNKHGFVVGVMEGTQWAEYELQMQPGDRLFLYTDGVPEATSKEDELFGTDRMLEALNTVKDASPEDVLKGVRKAIDNFVKDAEQFDDLTMLSIVYKGPQA